MQGLDLESHGPGSNYGAMDTSDFEDLPPPPQSNNNIAAWYDTDL